MDMSTARIASFADLLTFLSETSTPHTADLERQTVELSTTAPPGTMVIRWEKALPYVQIIHIMVTDVPAARRAHVEEAICRANNAIALPGFGYAYDKDFIYMRLCVPMYEEGMLTLSFRKQIASVLSNASQFIGAFTKV